MVASTTNTVTTMPQIQKQPDHGHPGASTFIPAKAGIQQTLALSHPNIEKSIKTRSRKL